jgi:hypothetical protein
LKQASDRFDARIKAAESFALSSDPRTQEFGVGILRALYEAGELDTTSQGWVRESLALLLPEIPEGRTLASVEFVLEDEEEPTYVGV